MTDQALVAKMATEVVGLFFKKFQRRPNEAEQAAIVSFITSELQPSTPTKITTKELARERLAQVMAENDEKIREAVADDARGDGRSEEQIERIVADKMEELNGWRERTLDEVWNWSTEPNAPSLKVH